MKLITALCACLVLILLGGGYAFSTWSVIPPEHAWIAMALSASVVFLMVSMTLMAASKAWPAGEQVVRRMWRDREEIPYFQSYTVTIPNEKMSSIGFAFFTFGMLMLVGIYAVAIARNWWGFTLQPLNLGPTLEPLSMLVLLAFAGTTTVWLKTKNGEPNLA